MVINYHDLKSKSVRLKNKLIQTLMKPKIAGGMAEITIKDTSMLPLTLSNLKEINIAFLNEGQKFNINYAVDEKNITIRSESAR